MGRPFVVASPYQPAGDQPTAIRELVEGIRAGLMAQTLLGVTGSGKTFTIANVVQEIQRPTIVMAPNKTLAAQLYGEFKEFFPNNAIEYFVSYSIITSPKRTCRRLIPISRKTHRSTSTSNRCACRRPKR